MSGFTWCRFNWLLAGAFMAWMCPPILVVAGIMIWLVGDKLSD